MTCNNLLPKNCRIGDNRSLRLESTNVAVPDFTDSFRVLGIIKVSPIEPIKNNNPAMIINKTKEIARRRNKTKVIAFNDSDFNMSRNAVIEMRLRLNPTQQMNSWIKFRIDQPLECRVLTVYEPLFHLPFVGSFHRRNIILWQIGFILIRRAFKQIHN